MQLLTTVFLTLAVLLEMAVAYQHSSVPGSASSTPAEEGDALRRPQQEPVVNRRQERSFQGSPQQWSDDDRPSRPQQQLLNEVEQKKQSEDRFFLEDAPAAEQTAFPSTAVGLLVGFIAAVVVNTSPAALAEQQGKNSAPVNFVNGAGVFQNNCAACHAGGNNRVVSDKNLKKETLLEYGMFDVDLIKYQVTNGKNAMPAFGERLSKEDISDVANFVLSQAEIGWAS